MRAGLRIIRHDPTPLLAAALLTLGAANSAVANIDVVLGKPAPGFVDGDFPTILQINDAVSTSPPPFDGGIGSDPLTDSNFSAAWTFNYLAPALPIASTSVTIGIVDHDSASAGDQVQSFSLDGFDLTALLNAAFNARGGASGEYNVYQVSLPAAAFASLTDGQASFGLLLTGPVDSPPPILPDIPPNPPDPSNGAILIFSSLSITPVPEPGTFALMGMGLLGLGVLARWRRRAAE